MKNLFFIIVLFFVSSSVYSQNIKNCEFAGSWYPADSQAVNSLLDKYFREVDIGFPEGTILGIISPHAGYQFSGPVAAYSYKGLKEIKFDTAVILCPTHRYYFKGIAVYPSGFFQTPLGNLEIDSEFVKCLAGLSFVQFEPMYFSREHSVEAQLPFLAKVSKDIKIVPVIFGDMTYRQMSELSEKLVEISKEKRFIVIVSSDLSHFHPYEEAKQIDADTVKLIDDLKADSLWNSRQENGGRACGICPVVTLLLYAKGRNADIKILKYANSGDSGSDKKSVVGYLSAVAYAEENNKVSEEVNPVKNEVFNGVKGGKMEEFSLTDEEKITLLRIARSTLENYLKDGKEPPVSVDSAVLKTERGAFVTLHKKGELRGCIGRIVADTPLYKTISQYAIHAAADDSRFSPVRFEELEDIEIEISVLTPFVEVESLDEIVVGKHGLMIKKGFYSGLLLPQVPVEWGWDKKTFLEHLCGKAGLPVNAYKDAALFKFSAIVFKESDFKDLK